MQGQGSTFWVMIPLAASGSSAISIETTKIPANIRLDGLVAVVVDDSQETREVVQTILMAAGATVQSGSSVQEGLLLIENNNADVIITDLAMPHESGIVLIEKVLKSKHSKFQ